jgi:hypothetical protein
MEYTIANIRILDVVRLVHNNESEQRNFTHLIRCQTKSKAIHNIKHVKKACYRVIMRKKLRGRQT